LGEDYIKTQFDVPAAIARREGDALFNLVMDRVAACHVEAEAVA
jgi:hypothetical protein